jgi:hypothetical protein
MTAATFRKAMPPAVYLMGIGDWESGVECARSTAP